MSQLPPGFVLDGAPPQQPTGPVYGAPPKPDKPDAPKTTWRTLTPQEVKDRGLRPDKRYQESSEGKVEPLGGDQQGTEGQTKSAGFLLRALQANDAYKAQEIDARSLAGQTVSEWTPGILNSLPESIGNSPRRQVADSSQNEFIAATLRYESGAAIPPAELEAQRSRYFPMPGDSEDAVKAKANLRATALEALIESSGPEAESAFTKFQGMPKTPQAREAKDLGESVFGGGPDGLEVTVTDDRPGGPPPPDGGGPGMGIGDKLDPRIYDPSGAQGLFDLGAQGMSLGLSDEAAGIGGAISSVFTGQDPLDAYRRERDMSRENLRQAREAFPIAGTAVELLAGGGGGKVLANAGNALWSAARQGASFGGIAGFGYGDGAASAPNALLGAATGGVVGAGLAKAGNALSARAARSAPDMEVVTAGQRQGIPIRQADARPEVRGDYAAMESTQGGGRLIKEARDADAAAIEARAVDATKGVPFRREERQAMGQSVQNIAERGTDNVKEAASAIYKRVARIAPDFKVPGSQTTAFIDNKIAELQARSPSGYQAEVSALQGMKDDLGKTGLSVETLQAQRETVGGRISDNIADRNRADRTLTEVLKVASDELHTSMAAANPNAAALLKRADAKWGQYKDLQREVTSLFVGKRGDATAESAARGFDGVVNRNYKALRRFMTLATPEERADLAATVAQNYGLDARGAFSPALFAKNVGNASDRTLSTVFGADGRAAMRDLQLLSNAKTDAMTRQAPSGKAIASQMGGLKTLLMGAVGFGAAGPSGAVAGGVAREFIARWGERRAARMLLNPDFTKWLKNAPNTTNPQAIDRYFGKLAGISSIAANDNQAFTQAILNAVKQSPGRVSAAGEQEDDTRRKPPQ